MKPLFWRRYIVDPDSKKETVWQNIGDPEVNLKEIEEMFQEKKKPQADTVKLEKAGAS